MKAQHIAPDSYTVISTIRALYRTSTNSEATYSIIAVLMSKDISLLAPELVFLREAVEIEMAKETDCLTIAVGIDLCKWGYNATKSKHDREIWLNRARKIWRYAHSQAGPGVVNANCLTSLCEFLIPLGEVEAREAVGLVGNAFGGGGCGGEGWKRVQGDKKLVRHCLGMLRGDGLGALGEEVLGVSPWREDDLG
jgi:hypothetical protein